MEEGRAKGKSLRQLPRQLAKAPHRPASWQLPLPVCRPHNRPAHPTAPRRRRCQQRQRSQKPAGQVQTRQRLTGWVGGWAVRVSGHGTSSPGPSRTLTGPHTRLPHSALTGSGCPAQLDPCHCQQGSHAGSEQRVGLHPLYRRLQGWCVATLVRRRFDLRVRFVAWHPRLVSRRYRGLANMHSKRAPAAADATVAAAATALAWAQRSRRSTGGTGAGAKPTSCWA